MAFDAGMAAAVTAELRKRITDAKVERVFQPAKDEIILVCRKDRRDIRLLISANPSSARVSITELERENPKSPPMFCMQLRKHLQGAVVKDVYMYGFERVIEISFSAYDELGFACEKYLTAEIMGKYSNVLLLGGESGKKKILGLIRPVDFTTSSRRQALPGMTYELPPPQDKVDLFKESEQSFLSRIRAYPAERGVDKFILDRYLGIAPVVAREISYRAGRAENVGGCSPRIVWKELSELVRVITEGDFTPCMIIDGKKPVEYSFIDINQYGAQVKKQAFESFSTMFDFYFGTKEKADIMREKAHDIEAVISSARHKLQKKIPTLEAELAECDEADKFKLWGDLITASIYMLDKKAEYCDVINYYSEDLETVRVPLDVKITPSQNAARYYKKYTKYKTARTIITEQLKKAESELAYLLTVEAALKLAENEAELAEIRIELASSGYSPKNSAVVKAKAHAKFEPKHYVTSGGYECIVGKNNVQNDYVTTKLAKKSDWWFHVKGGAGSHVVMVCPPDVEPDAKDFTEAAELAAYFSSFRDGENVAVDYTRAQNVKKPSGSVPGYVIYHTNYTAYVDPKCCESTNNTKV